MKRVCNEIPEQAESFKKYSRRNIDMADIKYNIVKEIGVLSEGSKGWRKELNLISWNNGNPK